MALSFAWLRYGLIVIPALGSLFDASIHSYNIYILDILLFLWLTQIRDKWLANRFQPLFIVLETGFVGWLSYQFPSGVFFLLIYSTLLSCYSLQDSKLRYFFMTLQFAVLLSSVAPHGTNVLIVSALLYLVCGILLFHVHSASTGKVEVEQLYDQLRRKHYELDEAGKRIIDYAKKVGDLAQIEERSRISGDIHDDLGHKLIRLKMMMEAIIRIIDKQPEKGMDLLLQVRDQLTESMETLRSTVRRLKPNEASSKKYTLASLIEDLVQNSGIVVSFNTTGRPFPLYPSEEVVLYRNAQEAVTNAIRHGQATSVHITLTYEPKQLVMQVSNNGTLPHTLENNGSGIKGMEERTQLLGGQLKVIVQDCFAVTTILPNHQVDA